MRNNPYLQKEENDAEKEVEASGAPPGWYTRLRQLGMRLPDAQETRNQIRAHGMRVVTVVNQKTTEAEVIDVWAATFHLRHQRGVCVTNAEEILAVAAAPFARSNWKWGDVVEQWRDGLLPYTNGESPLKIFALPPQKVLGPYTIFVIHRDEESNKNEPEPVREFFAESGTIGIGSGNKIPIHRVVVVHAIVRDGKSE